jgi:hypothetical protein
MVGRQHGWLFAPQLDHGQLPQQALIAPQRGVFVEDTRRTEGTGRRGWCETSAATSGTDPQPGIQTAHVRDPGAVGLEGSGALLIATTRQPGEALLAQQYGKGIDADGVPARGQFALNVVDREVALAQSHHLFADRIAGRSGNERQRVLGRKTPAKTVSELDLVNTA